MAQLIDQSLSIGRQITSCEIPVVYQGVGDNITRLELSQGNNGNYYVSIW